MLIDSKEALPKNMRRKADIITQKYWDNPTEFCMYSKGRMKKG